MAMREAFAVGIVLQAKDMYSAVMKKAERNLGILRKSSKESADVFEKSLKRYQGLAVAGAAITAVSAQLSGKIQEMTKDAVDFSAAMGNIGTVIDITGTKFKSNQAVMEAWRTKAMEVSTRSLFDATSLLNDSAYELMSAGLKADEAMDLLESVSKTAIATRGNLLISSKLFGAIMNTFAKRWNLSSLEKGERIMTALSVAVKKYRWTGDILSESLSWATAAAKGANVEFEETITALGMMNTRGWEASKAGMAIQVFLREISKGAKKMGISVTDSSGQLLPLADVLEKIHKKFGEMNLEKQDRLVAALGARGARFVQILYGEHEALRQGTKELKNRAIADEMVQARMKELNAQVALQEHRWQNLRIELGGRSAPIVVGLKKKVLDLVEALGDMPGAREATGWVVGIVGIAAEIGKALGPAIVLVGMIGMWKTQIRLAKAAQMTLNAEMTKGTGIAATQAGKMGVLGSRGMALTSILGKISAIGAAAFIGWEIGTLLRQIPGLDEAVQNLFATLTGAKIGEEMEKEGKKAMEILKKIREGLATEEEKKFLIKFEWELATKQGYSLEQFTKWMEKKGLSTTEIKTHLGMGPARGMGAGGAAALFGVGTHQVGTKRVGKTGLVIVHEGEEIKSKAMARGDGPGREEIGLKTMAEGSGGAAIIKNYFGDIILPPIKSTGSAPVDARNFAREIMKEINRMMKSEAKRIS